MIVEQTSKKHHYVPAFYLKRWCNEDGKLFEFSRPHKEVKAKKVSPQHTGFEYKLYELRGVEDALAQQVEDGFFKTLDTLASQALDLIDRYGNDAKWTDELRSAWTRFILSLLLRSPEDVASLRLYWPEDFAKTNEESEARYQAAKKEGDPETFSEFLRSLPQGVAEKGQFKIYLSLIDNPEIGRKINGMFWRIIEVSKSNFSLMTSDRPIIKSSNLISPGSHIALPIGPSKLFVASHDSAWIKSIQSVNADVLVKECNLIVVASAARFVYSCDESQSKFVAKRFSTQPQMGLLEKVFQDRLK